MQCRVMRDAGLVLFVALAMMCAGSLCAAEDPQLAEIVKALQSEVAGSKCPTAAIRRAGGNKDSPGAATLIHAGLFLLRSGLIQKAKACILQAQQKTPRSPWVWAAVAEALRAPGGSANAAELAEAALSQGLRLGGGISTGTPQLGLPMHWDVLGPFPIGKAEVDGDPLESPAIGGVARARTSARGERRQFPSEYAEGGFVQWRVLPAATPVVQIEFPDVEAPPVPPPDAPRAAPCRRPRWLTAAVHARAAVEQAGAAHQLDADPRSAVVGRRRLRCVRGRKLPRRVPGRALLQHRPRRRPLARRRALPPPLPPPPLHRRLLSASLPPSSLTAAYMH